MVSTFVRYFYRHIREKNVYEILSMYETSFAKITDKYFKATPWPTAEAIAPDVDYDHVFGLLYKEIYFRHIYAKLTPTLEQRCESWDNYCQLFSVILQGNVNMQLPNLWLWEMIDEFCYQFQSFCTYRSKLGSRSAEEVELLKSCGEKVWSVLGVVNFLQALVDKSGIVAILEKERKGAESFSDKEGYDYHSSNVLRVLGYFALIGLCRVHCLLGDYHGALRALDPIDLDRPGLYTKVAGSHITALYYVGFSYLMMRRYTDCIRSLNTCLVYVNRSKGALARSASFEQVLKKNDQMVSLLAMAFTLCPSNKLLEDDVKGTLQEKFGDKMVKMQMGEEAVFDELFSYACPKFITPQLPSYDDPLANNSQEAYRLQLKMFLQEVRSVMFLPLVRSFLKLYTVIPMAKLAGLMEVPEASLRQQLLAMKRKTTLKEWRGGASALDGEWVATGDVGFFIDGENVHVLDHKPPRRFVHDFVSGILEQKALERTVATGGAGTELWGSKAGAN